MRYICLFYPDTGDFTAGPQEVREFVAVRAEMHAAGVFLAAGQLQPADSATTLRVRDGEPLLTDGPFAEMKEHVAGYVLMECADLDEAVRWAARLPGARGGAFEIRPL